jgi:hypothetical protein
MTKGQAMSKCKWCGTSENIVFSGLDAFLLGVTTENVCYDCAADETSRKLETTNVKLG